MLHFPRDIPTYGLREAAWLLRFRATGPWYEHLKSDRYLTPAQFDVRYGAVFDGADLTWEQGLRTMYWQSPAGAQDESERSASWARKNLAK